MSRRRSDPKIASLQREPSLAMLADEEAAGLASFADLVEVPDGTVLTRQGQRGREAFLLVAGEAAVRRDGQEIARVGPGEFVGELALLDHRPRTADVVTVGAARVLVFDPDAFEEMLDSAPGLTRRLLDQVSSRLRAVDEAPVHRGAHG